VKIIPKGIGDKEFMPKAGITRPPDGWLGCAAKFVGAARLFATMVVGLCILRQRKIGAHVGFNLCGIHAPHSLHCLIPA